jgi:gamma-glutamylcyclotransferase (GGCT)/AIG2-like uncharacterized protein YtfP
MTQQLPFFVYGTLRRGQHNHRITEGMLAGVHAARLSGHVLYEAGLPYIGACGGEGTVTGDLLVPRPGDYDEVLHRLDRLEGFRPPHGGLYVRIACPVTFAGADGEPWASGQAWVYHGGDRFCYEPRLAVPGGDWAAWLTSGDMHAGRMAG